MADASESHYFVAVDRRGEHPLVTITEHGIERVSDYPIASTLHAMRLGAAVAYGSLAELKLADYTDPTDFGESRAEGAS